MKNAIQSSSISTKLEQHPTMLNCGDAGDVTTWVTAAGAKHGGASIPPKLEVDVFPVLPLRNQQIRGSGFPSACRVDGKVAVEDELPADASP
jgi:hypothetical protein